MTERSGAAVHLRDPTDIYRRSFEIVRGEVDVSRMPAGSRGVALRMVHACGMPDIVDDLEWRGDPGSAGRTALAGGAAVLADSGMVVAGVIRSRLPASNPVLCFLREPGVETRARRDGTTRSAAAVDCWIPHLRGAVVAIGSAPTALFRLIELLEAGAPAPAVVVAMPVGFVGAAESKRALAATRSAPPFLALHGRRGGSAIAAAAVNAMAGRAG